jgi:hypothetical protein
MFKKLFLLTTLVAMLATATLTASAAPAQSTRVVGMAQATKLMVLDDQPATFKLIGEFKCDYAQVTSAVAGKTITIYAYDVKIKYNGKPCMETGTRTFKQIINLGNLVPGTYTILVNPGGDGKAQKKLKGFVAPLIPTPTPSFTPAP